MGACLLKADFSKLIKPDVNLCLKQCVCRRNKEIKSIVEGLGEKYQFSYEYDPIKVWKFDDVKNHAFYDVQTS